VRQRPQFPQQLASPGDRFRRARTGQAEVGSQPVAVLEEDLADRSFTADPSQQVSLAAFLEGQLDAARLLQRFTGPEACQQVDDDRIGFDERQQRGVTDERLQAPCEPTCSQGIAGQSLLPPRIDA
jgi:hypothetical protein